jgi:hypothetical protein
MKLINVLPDHVTLTAPAPPDSFSEAFYFVTCPKCGGVVDIPLDALLCIVDYFCDVLGVSDGDLNG